MKTTATYTNRILTVIALFLGAIAFALWTEPPRLSSARAAGIPDSGQQLAEIQLDVAEMRKSLDKLGSLLRSGHIKVQVVEADQVKPERHNGNSGND